MIHHSKHDGKEVKIIRCDDAGENKKLEETTNGKQWKLNTKNMNIMEGVLRKETI